MKWDTLDLLHQQSCAHVPEKYGYVFDSFHREDLHQALRQLARAHGVRIEFGRQAVDVDCAAGSITFEASERVKKDLVVVADGIRVC